MNSFTPDKTTRSWAWYDFANSSYVLIFQSFLLPVFFSEVLQAQGVGLSSWGLVNGISTFLGVALALIVGDYSDRNERLRVLNRLIVLAFVGMSVLSWAITSAQSFVPYLFILTNAFFIASTSISDSILAFIADSKNSTIKASGFGWGFGYIGGIICLLIVLVVQKVFGDYSFLAFFSVAIFYAVFSYVCVSQLKGLDLNKGEGNTTGDTTRRIVPRNSKILLVGFWLIAESITVTILFYSIYASSELKIKSQDIAVTLLIIQFVGFFATWLGGSLPQISKRAVLQQPTFLLGVTIVIWVVLIAYLSLFARSLVDLYIVAIMTGLVIGNTQSFIRSIYALSIERQHAGRQFGIFAVITQAAALVGTWAYGAAAEAYGQRMPMLFIAAAMIVGYLLVKWSLPNKSTPV